MEMLFSGLVNFIVYMYFLSLVKHTSMILLEIGSMQLTRDSSSYPVTVIQMFTFYPGVPHFLCVPFLTLTFFFL